MRRLTFFLLVASLILVSSVTWAGQVIQYNEKMVGAGHPTLTDTLNRGFLTEHNADGTHTAGAGYMLQSVYDTNTDNVADTAAVAATGDSATGFFPSGTVEHERGGLEADVSAWDNSIAKIDSGATSAVPIGTFGETLIADNTSSDARTTLGLAIGSNVQSYDEDLSTLASPGTWKVFYSDGSGNAQTMAVGASGTALCFNGTSSAPTPCVVSATPGGSDTQVQFNDGGSFGGDSGLVYDKDTNTLTLDNVVINDSFTMAQSAAGPGEYTFWEDADNGSEYMTLLGQASLTDNNSILTLPNATDTLVGKATTDTFTNKTYDTAGTGNVFTHYLQKDYTLLDPVAANSSLLFKAQFAMTITDIHCISEGTTPSITLQILECTSAGASCAGVDGATTITCDSGGAEDDGTLSNGSIDAGDWVSVVYGAPSGTVNSLSFSIYYSEAQ